MGLLIFVARGSNCTNGGISSQFDKLLAVNVDGPFDPSDDCPAVLLESHYKGILRVVPAIKDKGKWARDPRWAMFGGNYAATSDSRWSDACAALLGHQFYGAVCIHDRYETAEQMRSFD
jgi:hypothetical protein